MDSDISSLKGFNPGGSSGGLFLKLSDGDTVKVRLTSLPVVYSNSFTNETTGEIKVDTRFAFVVYNHDEDKAQIWVTNSATYGQQISPLLEDEEYGDWRKYDVKISRKGEKAQTRYYIRPGAKQYDLEALQLDQCEKVDIIPILSKSKGASAVMWLTEYRKQQEDQTKKSKDEFEETIVEDIGDEPINLDDIPF